MSKPQQLRKGKYKVINWGEYNKSLKTRGDLTIWFTEESIKAWLEEEVYHKSRGRQKQYSDLAIKTIYTLRQVFNLRLRQAEGFARSIFSILTVKLPTPDYTTVSRRIRKLSVKFITQRLQGKINLILDSSGIKVVGEKEWISYKYPTKQRKIWRKLHIGVTDDGSIIVDKVTLLRDIDIATVPSLLEQVKNEVMKVVGYGSYYKKRMSNYMTRNQNTKNSKFIGPPRNGSRNYGNRLKVEETFSRYKRIIGNKFKAQNFQAQENEARLSFFILNKMKEIGMPITIRVE